MKAAAVLAVVTLGACTAADPPVPPFIMAGIHIPDNVRYCPAPAKVPAKLAAIIGTTSLREGYDRSEKARLRDHIAAVECKRALAALVEMVEAYNAALSRAAAAAH
jgi:hypothetical protein